LVEFSTASSNSSKRIRSSGFF